MARGATGESVDEMAVLLDLTPSRLYRLLRKHTLSAGSGVLRRRVETRRMGGGTAGSETVAKVRKQLPADLAKEIVARYVAGEPAGLVAAAVGVSDERVYRLLRAQT